LDDSVADIPWELLDPADVDGAPPNAQEPWAIRVKLLRQLRTEVFRARVVDAGVDAKILVIGEPASPPEYPPLEGARTEAIAVRDQLAAMRGTHTVMLLAADTPGNPGPDAQTILNTLYESSWRIIHIAGHGKPAE